MIDKKEKKKIIDLLKFYRDNNSKIVLYNYKLRLKAVGKIIKLSLFFGNSYLVFDSESRGHIKMFLEDIRSGDIFPEKLKKEEKEQGLNQPRKQIPQSVKNELWMNHFGDRFHGKCFVCKKHIRKDQFEVGHVISVQAGGSDTLDNLRPICITCNRSMGTENLDDFKKRYH